MQREAPAMRVRQNLGELINEVQYRHDRIVITKAGRPVAALIDMALYVRIRRMDEEFAVMGDELAAAVAGVPKAEGSALLDEALRAARRKEGR
jgi:prevent-host-death family protein